MPGQLPHRPRSSRHSLILAGCRICKFILELLASYAYGVFVHSLSKSILISVISGATLFVLSQTLTQLGHTLSARRRFIGTALLWIMKILAALFESLAILSANISSHLTESSLSGKVTEAFVNLLRTEPIAVAMIFFIFFGIDLVAFLLPEDVIEWFVIVEGQFVVETESALTVSFRVPIDEAEVNIYYYIVGGSGNDVDADLKDSNREPITTYGRLFGNGARTINLAVGEYHLNLGNTFSTFSQKKVFLRISYRDLSQ